MPVSRADRSPRVFASRLLVALVFTLASPIAASDAATIEPASPGYVTGLSSTVSDQLSRALAYEHGEGMPKDQRIAAAIYCEATAAGSAEAAFRLGWMYANGRGVPRDDGVAAALFDLAAGNGHQYARAMLERMHGVRGLLPDCLRPVEPTPEEPIDAIEEGPDPLADLPPNKQKIADLVHKIAPRYGIDPRLALAVIAVESNFNAAARSVKDARGLMQLIPETAARFNVRNPYDALDNVRGGLAYLRWLLAYYRGEVALAAAAYNAGERTVDRYRGVPPYPETRDYVRRVLMLFRHDSHPFNPNIVEPSGATTNRQARSN